MYNVKFIIQGIYMRKIVFSPPDITENEINGVADVLRSGWITTGPRTKQFEKEIAKYCNKDKATCLNSASAAIELTLRLLGIGAGDEVIVPAYTYTATVSVVNHVGAKIIMIDNANDSYEMDYEQMSDAITERTKAIIAVDLAGVICDYEKIFSAIESKKSIFKPSGMIQSSMSRIAVIADSAHAFGASQKGKMSGEIADFTIFSFHAVKNLTTAEGGAVTWQDINGIDNDFIYEQYRIMSLHGQSKDAFKKSSCSWEYDIVYPAYKCNMTDITAAIGLKQLERFPKMLARRKEIITKYDNAFKAFGINILEHYGAEFSSSGHLYLTRIPNITKEQRNEIIIKMSEYGIDTNVHYKPLPMMTAYMKLGFDIKNYPNAYKQFENEITLPLYSILTDDDVDYIIDRYSSVLKNLLCC